MAENAIVGIVRRKEGRKHGASRSVKPLRLIRDGEVGEGGGWSGILYLTPSRHTVTTRLILHEGGQLCEPYQCFINCVGKVTRQCP